jgi:EpsD family peptidyl-prolyl cis-trans isomerase
MKPHRHQPYLPRLVLALTMMIGGVSCSESPPQHDPAQLAARVNAEEITADQIAAILRSHARRTDTTDGARLVLEQLIDRELLVQRARQLDLDHDPKVLQAIESARKDILARAYVDTLMKGVACPEAAAISRFYLAHPSLFAQRRIFTLRELGIAFASVADLAGFSEEVGQLFAAADEQHTLEHLKRLAHRHDAAVSESLGIKSAEELPMDVLHKFASLQAGDVGYLWTEGGLVAYQIVSVLDAPLSELQARPLIRNILVSSKRDGLTGEELERLRGLAHIEYVGKFAEGFAAAGASGTGAVISK